MAERLLDLATGFSDVLSRAQVLTRRLLELHVFKLVALYTVWVALKEVSVGTLRHSRWPPWSRYRHMAAMIAGPRGGRGSACHCPQPPPARPQVSVLNFLLVVLWAFALPYPRFRPMASCLATVWTCIIIVCKMLYQLKVVSPHEYASNCTEVRPLLQLGWRDGCRGPVPGAWASCGGSTPQVETSGFRDVSRPS